MYNPIRIAVAAAAVVAAVAVVGINVLPRIGFGQPGPTPSPSPVTSPIPFLYTNGENLSPGTYTSANNFPVRITFEVPEGWWAWESRIDLIATLVDNGNDNNSAWGLSFWLVDNVYADPCDPTSELDPPVGPSVDDLVTALSTLPGYRATAPADIDISGFRGKQIELTAPNTGVNAPIIAPGLRKRTASGASNPARPINFGSLMWRGFDS